MERGDCPQPLRGCRYPRPFSDNHHMVWPAHEYTTPLEKKYRELDVNVVRGICRCIHDLEHLKKPPEKPSVEVMRKAVDERITPQP